MPKREPARVFLNLNERGWRHLPAPVRDSRPVCAYGAWLHRRVRRHADREMYFGTHFFRNRPALDLMCRLAEKKCADQTVRIAVLGCSIGAEVYSIVWTLRRARPDRDIALQAVDISAEVVEFAEEGVYGPGTTEMVHSSIFERMTDAELKEMFDWDGDDGRVKAWLRDGISWQLGDAGDPALVTRLGQQDIVVANNFLCHMPPREAERCLRNVARFVSPGGYIFIAGVDLDVRAKVAQDLRWTPVREMLEDVHDGDPLVRADWPWRWWGLEPFNPNRADWAMRYATVFQLV